MNYENMKNFKYLYDNISTSIPPEDHLFIMKYIEKYIGNFHKDNFYTGVDHESVRKLIYNIENETITQNIMEKYGLTKEEISSYTAD
jgi:hypothetical protein